jgi:hypothetical protein
MTTVHSFYVTWLYVANPRRYEYTDLESAQYWHDQYTNSTQRTAVTPIQTSEVLVTMGELSEWHKKADSLARKLLGADECLPDSYTLYNLVPDEERIRFFTALRKYIDGVYARRAKRSAANPFFDYKQYVEYVREHKSMNRMSVLRKYFKPLGLRVMQVLGDMTGCKPSAMNGNAKGFSVKYKVSECEGIEESALVARDALLDLPESNLKVEVNVTQQSGFSPTYVTVSVSTY